VTLSRIRSARATITALGLTTLGHLNCGVAAAVLYTWMSPERNPNDGQEWYGINGVDGTATRRGGIRGGPQSGPLTETGDLVVRVVTFAATGRAWRSAWRWTT
jgi:hypothetical protein